VFFVLCTLALFSSNAAYADPNFTQVDGGTSADSPGLAFLNGISVMMARANDTTNAMWYSVNNGPWTRVPTGTTLAAPALVTWNSNVVAVSTGEDGNLYSMVMSNPSGASSTWAFNTAWKLIPGTNGNAKTNLRPALAAGPDDLLYLFATYNNQTINLTNGNNTGAGGTLVWNGQFDEVPGNGFTTSSVGAGFSNGILLVAQTGTDHHLYVQSLDLDQGVWQNLWVDFSAALTSNLSFGTAVTPFGSQGSEGGFVVCGVDGNVLRIDCTEIFSVLDPDGKTFTYFGMTPSVLNVPGVPEMMHSPTLAFDTGSSIAVAATFSNPASAPPDVWLSGVKTFSALVTSGQ
jgi:hypothetical protein